MSIAPIPAEHASETSAPAPPGPYAHYANIFSRIFHETGSIEIALEVYETYRAREDLSRPKRVGLPQLIVQISARLFGVAPHRVYEPDRHDDVVAARRVVAWLLRRRRWSTLKIGSLLRHDHSTILFGLRRVAADQELLIAAHRAEAFLDLVEREGSR